MPTLPVCTLLYPLIKLKTRSSHFLLPSGITDSNKSDALWCLNTSAAEKRVRYAAKSLFARIGGSQGGVVSKEEYIEAINSLTVGHEKERKILLAAGGMMFNYILHGI